MTVLPSRRIYCCTFGSSSQQTLGFVLFRWEIDEATRCFSHTRLFGKEMHKSLFYYENTWQFLCLIVLIFSLAVELFQKLLSLLSFGVTFALSLYRSVLQQCSGTSVFAFSFQRNLFTTITPSMTTFLLQTLFLVINSVISTGLLSHLKLPWMRMQRWCFFTSKRLHLISSKMVFPWKTTGYGFHLSLKNKIKKT